jgi:hypothetical protein
VTRALVRQLLGGNDCRATCGETRLPDICNHDLLRDEIALSLPEGAVDELEEELADWHLLDYCRVTLECRRAWKKDGKVIR